MIDDYLKEFVSAKARRKLYALAALVQTIMGVVAGTVAGNDALAGTLAEWPLAVAVISSLGALITLLAKANVTEDDEA